MKYIEGWFIKAFGSELHVEQIIYDSDNELSKKAIENRFAEYICELDNLGGVYYLCFFHKSEKNKRIKSNLLVMKTKQEDDFLRLVSVEMEDVDDIKYLGSVYLDVKRGL